MKTILLVENEEMLRNLVKELLDLKNYQVLEATQGVEALALMQARSNQVDLVLTDVVMPHMNGAEMVQRLREANPGLKVIFMSGHARTGNDFISKALELPGAAFLQKPFRLSELVDQVEQLLGKDSP